MKSFARAFRAARTVAVRTAGRAAARPAAGRARSLAAVTATTLAAAAAVALAPPEVAPEEEAQGKASAGAAEGQAAEEHKVLPPEFENMRLFSGRANRPLAEAIASNLGVELGDVKIQCFADGEIGISVNENVRGKDIYIVQPTCPPDVNSNLMELLLLTSTMRRASAASITVVLPYYAYARQDRKMKSRVPISAADVARLLESVGVDRVVAVDLHCGQIQGFFSPRTPVDNLEASVVGLKYFLNEIRSCPDAENQEWVVISPDAGGVGRAKAFRDQLKKNGVDAGLAMLIKQRARANEVESMDLVGTVEGMNAIMIDDMIDTAGTLTKAAAELKARGAGRVFAFCTHGLLNGPAIQRIKDSPLEKLLICDTVPLSEEKKIDQVVQLSTADLLANAITRIQTKASVSDLFR